MNKWKLVLLCSIYLIGNQSAISGEKGLGFVISPFKLSKAIKEVKLDETNPIKYPSKIDLSQDMPTVGNQGKQNSSVAWAIGYVKSYYKSKKNTISDKPMFSPDLVYKQNNEEKDNGSTVLETLRVVTSSGSFNRVDFTDLSLIKYQLSKGNPLVVGILVYENLFKLKGSEIYSSGEGKIHGGQAVVIVGYDDSQKAFKIMNSWGNDWGDNGYGYIDYKWFAKVCREAWLLQNTDSSISDMEAKIIPPEDVYATKGNYKNKISIVWKPVLGSIGYIVYRRMPGKGGFQKVGITGNTKFDDTGSLSNRAYVYSIASVFEDGQNSDFSESSTGFRDDNAKNNPGKVVGLNATNGKYSHKVYLEWQAIEEKCSYKIYKWENKKSRFKFLKKVENSNYTDENANKNGFIEFYAVKPFCNGHQGILSDAAIGRTSGNKVPSQILSVDDSKRKPQLDFQLIPNDKNFDVVLNWSFIKNAKEYKLWEKIPGKTDWREIQTLEGIINTKKFELPSLDTFYLYAISSKVNGIYGELSKPITIAYSLPVESKLPRTFGVVSQLEKFKGVWTGMQWTKGIDVTNIVLKIDSEDNSTFVVTINNKKQYKGNYVNDAKSLTVGKKLQIELSKNEDALVVQLDDSSIVEEPAKLPFLRE